MAKLRTRIGWWEPYWSWFPEYIKSLREGGLFTLGFWTRPVLVSAIILAALVAWATWQYPGVQVPLLRLIGGLFIVPFMLAVYSVGMFAIPRHIDISPKRILVSTCGTAMRIEPAQLDRARLVADGRQRLRLILEYRTRRERHRSTCIGVPQRVDLRRIAECLPEGMILAVSEDATGSAVDKIGA